MCQNRNSEQFTLFLATVKPNTQTGRDGDDGSSDGNDTGVFVTQIYLRVLYEFCRNMPTGWIKTTPRALLRQNAGLNYKCDRSHNFGPSTLYLGILDFI